MLEWKNDCHKIWKEKKGWGMDLQLQAGQIQVRESAKYLGVSNTFNLTEDVWPIRFTHTHMRSWMWLGAQGWPVVRIDFG